jgi:hypothetical protein
MNGAPDLNTYFVHTLLLKQICFVSGSCHFDRLSNVEIGVECQIFIIFFSTGTEFYNLGHIQGFIKVTQKRSFLVIRSDFMSAEKIKTNIQH